MTDTILHELPAARVLGRTVSCLITNGEFCWWTGPPTSPCIPYIVKVEKARADARDAQADIFDVDNIIQVNRNASVIEMDPGAKWELTSDYHLAVPFNVEVLKVGSVDGSTLFCKSGTELRQTLEADASFQAKYMVRTPSMWHSEDEPGPSLTCSCRPSPWKPTPSSRTRRI